jgi:cyclic pyranopterin phosphate synthase
VEPLHDAFGRVIDYLRISVTDRCNLRCVYCMPLAMPDLAEGSELLTAEEIETTVRAAVALGFRKFRLTGGEPTVRPDIVEIVLRCSRVFGVDDLSMTTNAVRLAELAQPLADAGLDRVNVHVDTLDDATLPQIMRLGSLERIRAGITAAEEAGLTPIKLNVVVVRGMNHHQVADLARLTLDLPWHVRFIELMPLGAGDEASLSVRRYVSSRCRRRTRPTRARTAARTEPSA